MNQTLLHSVVLLLLEICFVASASLVLFRLRKQISLGPLYIFIGTNQFLSIVLAATVYISIGANTIVSPGSVVLFASTLFTILLVYLRTDIPTTRGLIYGIVLANATLSVLLWITAYQLSSAGTLNLLGIPMELFTVSPAIFMVGTTMLVTDCLLVVVLHELLTYRAGWLPLYSRILINMTVVLLIDSLVFSMVLAWGENHFVDVLRGQILGKVSAGLVYSTILYAFLRIFEPIATRDKANELEDVFSIFTYRERYHQVREKLEVAEAANLAKSRFLTNMSHELRTPLNAIIGFTSILFNRHPHDDEDKLFLSRVLENGKHLLELINGLLDLSKIESGRNELLITPVDVRGLIEETMHQLESQATLKSLTLRMEMPPAATFLDTDRMRLKQILINLIGNSLKFTDEGEVVARLTADPDSQQPLRLDILDSGIGIDESKLEDIFEPFCQDQTIRSSGGTGLGLAISRALCEQMGHELKVANRTGAGAQFSIFFGQALQTETIEAAPV